MAAATAAAAAAAAAALLLLLLLLLLSFNGGLQTTFMCIPPPTVQECVTSCHFTISQILLIYPVSFKIVISALIAFLMILIPCPSDPMMPIRFPRPPCLLNLIFKPTRASLTDDAAARHQRAPAGLHYPSLNLP